MHCVFFSIQTEKTSIPILLSALLKGINGLQSSWKTQYLVETYPQTTIVWIFHTWSIQRKQYSTDLKRVYSDTGSTKLITSSLVSNKFGCKLLFRLQSCFVHGGVPLNFRHGRESDGEASHVGLQQSLSTSWRNRTAVSVTDLKQANQLISQLYC